MARCRAAARGRPVSSLSAVGALNAFLGRHLPHRVWLPRVARAQMRLIGAVAFGWMDKRAKKISALLHEAAETHHIVYRITDGDDPDWASWYADWLVNHSELPDLLDVEPVRSELVYMLVRLDKKY